MPIYESKLVNFNFWRSLMKRFIGLLLFLMFTSISLIAQNAPLKISLQKNVDTDLLTGRSIHKIYITLLDDNLIINGVLVNRGHCKIGWKKKFFPLKLQYSKKMMFPTTCDIIEISVKTNQDDWSVEY